MSGSDARALARSLLDLCRSRRLTIATAESCTGGLVAGALNRHPRLGRGHRPRLCHLFQLRQARDARCRSLHARDLRRWRRQARRPPPKWRSGARWSGPDVDLAVSNTRIAGPGGATPGKPVGLVHFAVAARRPHPPPRTPLWRDRPQHRARAIGGRSTAHADGGRARAPAGQAEARRGEPHPPARDADAAKACGEAETKAAEGVSSPATTHSTAAS